MPRRGLALLLALAIPAVAFAGCVGSPEQGVPAHVEASASDPVVADGWDHSGQTLVGTTGEARLLADDDAGTGSFVANLTLANATYELSADTFRPLDGQPWTGNGVNRSVTLHGDTGRGTDQLPRTPVVVATWGPLVLTRAGELLPDPLTGEPELFAHVMVTEQGLRSDEDGSIRTRDGSVYDPTRAGEGRRYADDPELHAIVTSPPDAPTLADETIEERGDFQPPASNASVPVPVRARTATANVTVTVSPSADVEVTPAQVNASLVDPDGVTLRSATLGAQADEAVTWRLQTPTAVGNHSVEMESQGSARWNVTAEVGYPDPFLLHVTYEDVAWSAAG